MRRGHLTEKDMMALRENDRALVQQKKQNGTLKDYSLQHRVEINWDMNEEAKREQMFKFKIDDYEVILDAEELLRYLRWV